VQGSSHVPNQHSPKRELSLPLHPAMARSHARPLAKSSAAGSRSLKLLTATKEGQQTLALLASKDYTALLKEYRPYIEKITKGLARRKTDPIEDLIQVGSIGLLKAAKRYHHQGGSSFKTYATYYITGEIRQYLRDKMSLIKTPRTLSQLYYRFNQVVETLAVSLGRNPSNLEIAEALQSTPTQVEQLHGYERRREVVPLDEFLSHQDTEGRPLYLEEALHLESLAVMGSLQALEETTQLETRLMLDQALKSLSSEQRSLIEYLFYQQLTQQETAQRLGTTQMQVSRKLKKTLARLHRILSAS
jgi:RNA polymerase sigma-B factor